MTKAEFPFTYIGKTKIGRIYRPYVKIEISSDRIDEWVPFEAVIDTGADYTLLPRRYAALLNLDLMKSSIPETTVGVGGSETIYLVKKGVSIKIKTWVKDIPVGFLERDDIPCLLGRLQCLEIMDLQLKNLNANFILK